MKSLRYLLFALGVLGLTSCATYVTPDGPANLAAITDNDIAAGYKAKPAATYPANIAVVRVQQAGYRSYSAEGVGSGAFSVITSPDIESEQDLERLGALPGIQAVVRLNSLLLPSRLQSTKDIRVAASKLQTDFVLLYTIDTKFRSEDLSKPLTAVSLGIFSTRKFRVTSTASALLIDTRTGYVYGAIEEQSADSGIASAWGEAEHIDKVRRLTEREALDKLFESFRGIWRTVRR